MSGFSNLPGPAQAGIVVATGGGLMAGLWYIVPRRYFWLIIVAILIAGLALVIYKVFLNWRDKKKSKPFEEKLASNTGATPQGVTDATRRARVDDLRKSFDKGIRTFREHGKDMYSLPWYCLVGEPGSGKTEAVRHSNVGFPPGLQDQLQGSGGTINMNWWFTNNAVILDTAGRLMFEEVEAGKSNEWHEFLKLLRATRPNCPINGLLLVIPADSLITDSADEITAKAGKIAEQLDGIQRLLGVRFPAFVVITKSDLINGFREFFSDLSEPQQQYQMLGWSNPSELDTAFRPELVEEHIKDVAGRLRDRRMHLMLDPVHTEDPLDGKRMDEVDAMYAFPDAMLKIAPRLRLYLETVFVQGEWSTKPLFLRGIYFTSSLQEGAELDAELADAMGVDVKSLPGGGFRRSVSLFLRDLFNEKVFKERGLVTNATNAKQQQQRRKMIVLGGAIVGVLAMIGITWFNGQQFEKSIGGPEEFWSSVADVVNESPLAVSVIDRDNAGITWIGSGDVPGIEGESDPPTRASLSTVTLERALSTAYTPIMYRPVIAATNTDIWEQQREAHEQVLKTGVLDPLLRAAIERINDQPTGIVADEWSPQASEVLADMILIQGETAAAGSGESPIRIDALARFAIAADLEGAEVFDDFNQHITDLESVLIRTYGQDETHLKLTWPPANLAAKPDGSETGMDSAISKGVDALVRRWEQESTPIVAAKSGEGLIPWTNLANAAEEYAEQERLALEAAMGFESVQTVEQYDDKKADWKFASREVNASTASLQRAREELNEALEVTGQVGDSQQFDRQLGEKLEAARKQRLARLEREMKVVLDAYDKVGADETSGRYKRLKDLYDRINEKAGESADNVRSRLASDEVKKRLTLTTAGTPQYQLRYRVLGIANAELDRAAPAPEAKELDTALATIREEIETANSNIDNISGIPEDEREEIRRVAKFAVAASGRWRAHEAYRSAIASLEGSEIADLVAERDPGQEALPELPMTQLARVPDGSSGLDPRYSPEGAGAVFALLASLEASSASSDNDIVPLDADKLATEAGDTKDRLNDYREEYYDYWLSEIVDRSKPDVPPGWGWEEIHDQIERVVPRTATRDLRRVHERIGNAVLVASVTDSGDDARELHQRLEDVTKAADTNGLNSNQTEELERIAAELKYINDDDKRDDLNDTVVDVLDEWISLGGNVRSARRRLWTNPSVFNKFYAGVWSDKDPDIKYWSDFLDASTSGMGASWQEASGNLVANIRRDSQFPVYADAAQPMTWERVVTVWKDASSMASASLAAEDASEKPADPKLEQIDSVGDLVVKDISEAERAWLRRISSQLQPIASRGEDQVPRAQIQILEPADLPQRDGIRTGFLGASSTYRRVWIPAIQERARPSRAGPEDGALTLGAVYRDAGEPLELLLYEGVDDPLDAAAGPRGRVAKTIQIPAPWTMLRWLLESNRSFVLEGPKFAGQGWRAIPIQANTYTYWIAVRIIDADGKPITIDPGEWLKTSDAPSAGS